MKESGGGLCRLLVLAVASDPKGWSVGLTADAEGVPSHLHVADGQLPARQFLSHHPSLTFATMLTQGFDASSVRLDVVDVEAGARLRLDCW